MARVRERRLRPGTVRCPQCRAVVAAKSTKCPHCGGPVSRAQALKTVGIVVFAAGLVASVASQGHLVAIVIALFGLGIFVFGRFA